MSGITQSRGLRTTVWLASTYICFLVASTAPWQQPSADQAPRVTSGVSLAAPPFSGAGLPAGLGDVAPFAGRHNDEVRPAVSAEPEVWSTFRLRSELRRTAVALAEAVEADRSARRAREAFKGIRTRARIDVSRQALSEVERVAPVVAAAATDIALRHVAAAIRSIDRVRVKKAIAAAECAETRTAAKLMVAEIAADAIEHLVVRGVEAAVAHSAPHFLFTVASIKP